MKINEKKTNTSILLFFVYKETVNADTKIRNENILKKFPKILLTFDIGKRIISLYPEISICLLRMSGKKTME